MDMFPGFGGLVPTQAEVAALDALLDHDDSQVSGLIEVAELIALACQMDGEEIPAAVAAELAVVRRSGGASAAVRRAGVRTVRRAERAKLRILTGTLADGVRVGTQPRSAEFAQVTGGWAA